MNAWCEVLGIAVPSLAAVRGHREAGTYSLMLVALLERGSAMTLVDIAEQFAAAKCSGSTPEALASIKRCRPARAPVYCDGELYSLDPHDHELDLWVFRLGLRPPRVAPKPPVPQPPRASGRLTVEELDLAWRDASLEQWSMQRIALAVLDTHDGSMTPDEVLAFVAARTKWHRFTNPASFNRKNSAIAVGVDERWSIRGGRELAMARDAVRDLIESRARHPQRSTPDELAAADAAWKRRRAAHAAELASLRRVLVVPFPAAKPRLVTLLDIADRKISTVPATQVDLQHYDVLCGDNIRATLRNIGIDPGQRRLSELGPPQKTAGPVKLTTEMFVHGSCGLRLIADAKLATYSETKLVPALEANARALFALHEYGKLHREIRRIVSRTEYEMLHAPWHDPDEPTLYGLMKEAFDLAMGIVVVGGAAPDWASPWARAERMEVIQPAPHAYVLVDGNGLPVDEHDIQLARLEATVN